MILEITKKIMKLLSDISYMEYSQKSHQVEYTATYNGTPVIFTTQMKEYVPRDVYGEGGYFYEKERQRKVKENGQWIIKTDMVTYYELSPADKKFIYVNYVYNHLTQRQISKLSGVPQPYVFRYIKHMKLKPRYDKTINVNGEIVKATKKNRVQDITSILGEDVSNVPIHLDEELNHMNKCEVDPNIDFEKPFHVKPYPNRSEWKVERENLGLKNAEDWRNHNYADGELKPKAYGDGSKSFRKKASKLERRERRRIRAIQKNNLHQNNRYNMTEENPEGDLSKRLPPREVRREQLNERNKNKKKN